MSAYILFGLIEVSDPDALAAYRATAPKSMVGRDIKFLAGPKIAQTLEAGELQGVVIMEFTSVAAAQDWYYSPAYQEAAQLRFGASKCFAYILDGRPPLHP